MDSILSNNNIYAIPVGDYFAKDKDACYMIYAPLANAFYLSLPNDVKTLVSQLKEGKETPLLKKLLSKDVDGNDVETTTDSFCTLHLLLNEKCNFSCKYCYSAFGRSTQELNIEQIYSMLAHFLSSDRNANAVKERTVMFMGGGEPVLSWNLLEQATLKAEALAESNNIKLHLALTTNGSVFTDAMLDFLKQHNFTVQISFEILPDVQNAQRGNYEAVDKRLKALTEKGINNYVRSTITENNVDRISEMVEYCHLHFPKVTKMSCQQVVDPEFFKSREIVEDFFNRYHNSFQAGVQKAEEYGITLRSSSSHLLNYSKREKFCYNLLCLTPYGTLTLCPDVSSPKESDYDDSIVGKIYDGQVLFDEDAFARLSNGSIHNIEKCQNCYARWNCGSGCPSSRRVYKAEIFDAICDFYRKMLVDSLMKELANKYSNAHEGDFYADIATKL